MRLRQSSLKTLVEDGTLVAMRVLPNLQEDVPVFETGLCELTDDQGCTSW